MRTHREAFDGSPANRWLVSVSWWWVWPALAIVAWLPGIASTALFDPDEGRNASIARGMAENGDWLLPRLNGLPFLDKPFLYFALQAAALKLLGASELAARLPSVVAAILLVGLVAWFARRVRGRDEAVLAAVTCAASLLAIAFARAATFDALLALCTTAALVAFYFAIEDSSATRGSSFVPSHRRRWLAVAWFAMAVGTLIKGPVAILLPLSVAVAYALARRRWRTVWSVEGPALCFGLLIVWLAVMEAKVPGFLRYALVEESWNRVTTTQFQRTGPVWYFLPVLLAGCFPWSVPVLVGAREFFRGSRPSGTLFATLWLLLPLILLSLSQSKRPQYMLPLLPAVALLAARALVEERSRRWSLKIAATIWLLVGLVAAAAPALAGDALGRAQGLSTGEVREFAWRFAALALLAGSGGLLLARRRFLGIAAVALPIVALPALASPLVSAVSEDRSTRTLAAALAPLTAKEVSVVGIDTFVPSLPFYLGTSMILSAEDLGEMTSNSMLHFSREIASKQPESWRPADWWRVVLAEEPEKHAFVIKSSRRSEIRELEDAGLARIFASRKLVAFALPLELSVVPSGVVVDEAGRPK